jgi:hypothetical protein
VTRPPPSRKKRVRPARKIVPRGQMSPAWVLASLALAVVIAAAGVAFLLTRTG